MPNTTDSFVEDALKRLFGRKGGTTTDGNIVTGGNGITDTLTDTVAGTDHGDIVPTQPGIDHGNPYTSPVAEKKDPLKTDYSGSEVVGRTAEVLQQMQNTVSVDKQYGGTIDSKSIRINKWLGIYTQPSRINSPLGALEDCRNFVFNKKTGSMSMRTGSSVYASSFVDVTTAVTLATVQNSFHLSTESPSATNIDIVFGANSGGDKYIFQKPFFHGSSTATSGNIRLGDILTVSLKSYSTTSVVFTGGVNSADFYKNWILCNSTKADVPILITGSSYGSGDTTLTLGENAPTDWTNTTDSLILYRHFHDNYTFVPTYSSVAGRPPIALQQGNAVLLSGGMGSANGLKPIWTGYMNKTFFYGATGNTGGNAFQETYVSEAEIKNTSGLTISTGTLSSDTTVLPDGRWFFCVVPETDDGIRGLPIYASTKYVDTTTDKFSFTVTAYPGTLNKRLRYLNVFLGKAPNDADTTIDWNYLYYIERYDLCGSSWTWTKTADAPGYYITDANFMDGDKWNNNTSESLATHLGHNLCTSTTCSFSVGKFVNNRLFISKYYDYVDTVEYLDQIRYSDFAGNGKAQLNVLCNLDDQTQSTIEQGDATSVQALKKWEDKLFVLKDNSCYFISVTDDPIQWQLVTVSSKIGCKNPDTAVETPFMVIWCQAGEDIYGWSGSSAFSLAQNWLTTYKALDLTTVPSVGWYDNKIKTYNFSYYSTLGGWYAMFFECPIVNGFKWGYNEFGRTASPTTTYKIHSTHERAGVVYLAVEHMTANTYSILYFDSTATVDGAITISPYFKTTEFTLSEKDLMKILKVYLTLSPTTPIGQLDCKITVGSNTTTYSAMTNTLSLHSRGVPFTSRIGRKIQFEFNMNATRPYYAGLDIYELQYDYELVPFIGDNTITS